MGVDHGLLGVHVGGDAGRKGDFSDPDCITDVEVRDVDRDLVGNVGRLGVDGQAEEEMVDSAVLAFDLLGLADDYDADIDADLDIGAYPEENVPAA